MDRPNIILLFVDQMRGDSLGVDGHPCIETPNLDHLTCMGTHFRHAYSSTPSCIPARATLMTGMNAWHTGILGMGRGQGPMPNDFPHTLAGTLSRHGYRTTLIGKGHFHPQRADMGFQHIELDESGRVLDPGFYNEYRKWFDDNKPYRDLTPDDHGVDWNSWHARPWHTDEHLHPSAWTMTRALRNLEQRDQSKPFFINISFARPHSPYVAPPWYFQLYHDMDLPAAAIGDWADRHDVPPHIANNVNAWHGKRSAQEIHRARAGYYGEISFIDTQIGRLRMWMHRNMPGWEQNTLIIFASDHGDMLGDHHLWRKTYAYEGSARVPMIIMPPGGAKRHQADEPVELRDIMPTILDAAGIETPPTVDGQSLLPLCQEPASEWRSYVHGEHATCYSTEQEMQYVTNGTRKFIWLPRLDEEQYFDLENDPLECHNLIDQPDRQDEIAIWRQYLIEVLEERDCGWAENGKLVAPESEAWLVSPWRDKRYSGAES